jgi:hypothetical protein
LESDNCVLDQRKYFGHLGQRHFCNTKTVALLLAPLHHFRLLVQQQTITMQQQTDQQQKQNIGNQDIPFDINTIIPKTTVKLEPGINSTENICSSEWNTFAPNVSGNDVGELTTILRNTLRQFQTELSLYNQHRNTLHF